MEVDGMGTIERSPSQRYEDWLAEVKAAGVPDPPVIFASNWARKYIEELEQERDYLRGAVDALREWLDADDDAERDFNDKTEARLDAAIARARSVVGGQYGTSPAPPRKERE